MNEWFLWTIFGFIMVAARRYWAHKYGLSITLHVILATLASGITMYLGFSAKIALGWKFYQVNVHNKLATSMMFVAPATYSAGLTTLLTMKYYNRNGTWTNAKILARYLSVCHRFMGYCTLALAYIVITTGVLVFHERYDMISNEVGYINLAFTCLLFTIPEVIF